MLTFPGLLSNAIACSFRILHYVATCMVNRQTIEHMLSQAATVMAQYVAVETGTHSLAQLSRSCLTAAHSSQHGNQCAHGRALVSTRTVRDLNRCVMADGQLFGWKQYYISAANVRTERTHQT